MKSVRVALAVLTLVIFTVASRADDADSTYVEVMVGQAIGSGVLVDDAGQVVVVTCWHVVKGEAKATIKRRADDVSFQTWDVEVYKSDETCDLAILKFPKPPKLKGTKLAAFRAESGDAFVNVSSAERIFGTTRRGVVDSYQTHPDTKQEYVLLDYRGTYGASGSAIWINGKVAGIVCRFWSGSPNSALCAVPVNEVLKFLAEPPVAPPVKAKRLP